jgi:predicted dehydrogenase
LRLIGYDWETNGVYLDDSYDHPATLYHQENGGFAWQEGATKVAESIINKTEPKINVEHALHILEIMEAARKSSATGTKINLQSEFKYPLNAGL